MATYDAAAADAAFSENSRLRRWLIGNAADTPGRAKFQVGWAVVALLLFYSMALTGYPPETGAQTFFLGAQLAFIALVAFYGMFLYVVYWQKRESGVYAQLKEKERADAERAEAALKYARQGS